jgi:hypothetical protein
MGLDAIEEICRKEARRSKFVGSTWRDVHSPWSSSNLIIVTDGVAAGLGERRDPLDPDRGVDGEDEELEEEDDDDDDETRERLQAYMPS